MYCVIGTDVLEKRDRFNRFYNFLGRRKKKQKNTHTRTHNPTCCDNENCIEIRLYYTFFLYVYVTCITYHILAYVSYGFPSGPQTSNRYTNMSEYKCTENSI